jgi:hypothetical protein
MTRYIPSRHYRSAAVAAIGLAVVSGFFGLNWTPAFIPAALFVVSAAVLAFLAFQPPVEIHEDHLAIGKRIIPWVEIRRLDRTGWVSPLLVHIALSDDSRILLIYPGDMDSSNSLLRHLRRCSRLALLDGIPYRQFWGEAASPETDRKQRPSPRYQLLRPEDEAEVERLYQRLKTVGHIDPKNSSDEK